MYFTEKEKERLSKNLLDEDYIERLFEFVRDKFDYMEKRGEELLSRFPDNQIIKVEITADKKNIGYFRLTFDVLEMTCKNVIEQNKLLKQIINDSGIDNIKELQDKVKEQEKELQQVKNSVPVKWFERYFRDSSETTEE